jgi:hypothetical protein
MVELIGADKLPAALFAAERVLRPAVAVPVRGWRRPQIGALYDGSGQ